MKCLKMSHIFIKYMSFLWKRESISLLNKRFHSVGSGLFCRLETDQGPRAACSPTFRVYTPRSLPFSTVSTDTRFLSERS